LKAKKPAPKPQSILPCYEDQHQKQNLMVLTQGSANANAIECQGFRGDEEVNGGFSEVM